LAPKPIGRQYYGPSAARYELAECRIDVSDLETDL
jgi:hypothetical protein